MPEYWDVSVSKDWDVSVFGDVLAHLYVWESELTRVRKRTYFVFGRTYLRFRWISMDSDGYGFGYKYSDIGTYTYLGTY